jgi:hypothetical protein
VGASAWLFIVRFSPEEVKKASLSSIIFAAIGAGT